jgi:hypothetical protein
MKKMNICFTRFIGVAAPLLLAAACTTAPTAQKVAEANAEAVPAQPQLPNVVRTERSIANGVSEVVFEAGGAPLWPKTKSPDFCGTQWLLRPADQMGGRDVWLQTDCGADPSARLDTLLPLFEANLRAILKEVAPTAIKSVQGQFYQWSLWSTRTTEAAKTHSRWLTFLEKRGNRGFEAPNPFYVLVFNDSDAGRELRELFASNGLKIELRSAEKIFEKRFGRQVLPTGAGSVSYTATPLPPAAR